LHCTLQEYPPHGDAADEVVDACKCQRWQFNFACCAQKDILSNKYRQIESFADTLCKHTASHAVES
jgi:hypothetical protein